MSKPRLQFGLRTALLFLTGAAVLLAAGTLLPAGLRQFTIALLIIFAGSAMLFIVFWLGEQVLARYRSRRPLAIGSMMLTSVSTLVIILILLPLPGGRGPIPYWAGHDVGLFFFPIRVATVLVLPWGPVICGLIGKVRLELGAPFRLGWLIVAISSYVVAWHLVWSHEFFPTV